MKGKATDRQKSALLEFGLQAPTTKAGCSNLLSFLLSCRWRDMSREQKVAYAVATQKEWLGVRVDAAIHGIGTIDYITCQNPQDLSRLVRDRVDGESSPFRFHIKGDDDKGLGLASVNALHRV